MDTQCRDTTCRVPTAVPNDAERERIYVRSRFLLLGKYRIFGERFQLLLYHALYHIPQSRAGFNREKMLDRGRRRVV